ncbi:MAG TPA: sulfite exporter TauE/SafE family protein [Vicinamibacterales bacterium]|nr:sulfite exporter TauE/SafE family protein [Vicinamibacterales bacterium]
MPAATLPIQLLTLFAGSVAGMLGAMLGIGGGVFLVPFLNLALGFPYQVSAAISLTTVIATSSSVSAARSGRHLINMRLGMTLEVATAAGALLGGLTARELSQSTLQLLFGVVTVMTAVAMLRRMKRRNVILDPDVSPGRLGGRFHEDESGGWVTYRVKRLPLGLAASFIAGNLSSLLGIGGGVVKVPVLNAWCGVPMRAAAATSAFMIGVTATAGAVIYYGQGLLIPVLAAAAIVGVQIGSWAGIHVAARTKAKWLKLLMAIVLFVVSALMIWRGLR